ncbi:MAG: penicillin-binding protein [Bacteroidales bacterium]
MNDRNNILLKLNILYILYGIFGIVIIGQIIYLQFFYDKELIEKSLKSTRIYTSIEPTRGDIYSYDRKLLATSVAYFEVGIDPNCEAITQKIFNENLDSLAFCLSQLLPNKTKTEWKNDLINARDSGKRYLKFSNKLSYSDFKKMQNFPLLRKGKIKGGFVYQKKYEREMPFGILARRTIGTVASEGRKGVGLEDAFDAELRGKAGYTVKERLPGNIWMPVEDAKYVEPKDGMDLITTIDISLQDVAETSLERQLIKHNAEFGTVVVMEVKTGKVRAIANLKKHPEGFYYEEQNFAIAHAIDPGSTFKLASVIVAFEDGYANPEDLVETGRGFTFFFGKKVKDSGDAAYGTISIARAFEVSSNVGISLIIDKYYRHQPLKYVNGLSRLHLDKPLGVVIRGEAVPVIHKPGQKEWSKLSLTQMAIGYELQITPLQILAFYNAIANNGTLVKPIFVEALSFRGKIVKEFKPEIIDEQICSKKTLEKIKPMLEGVVENGTAKNIKSNQYKIAGKTGTAQIDYGRNKQHGYHSSFVGYFPADDPQYSCIVSIYYPRENGFYGSVVAGPVFKDIADKIYATNPKFHTSSLNATVGKTVPRAFKGNKAETQKVYDWLKIKTNAERIVNTDWILCNKIDSTVTFAPVSFSDITKIPNVINMGAKDAVFLLEQLGLKVIIKGRGKIISQNPAPGTEFRKGDVITLTLEL